MTSVPDSPAALPITVLSPLRWLRLGLRDFVNNPLPGLLHGLVLAIFGGLLLAFAADQFWWLAGAFSGFLMVAPVMATGLYAVSRQASLGHKINSRAALAYWWSGDRRLIAFGLLLAMAGTGWVLTSAGLITVWAPEPIEKPLDFVRHVVLAPSPGLFEVWLLLGAWLAAPVFASSVLTMPMLLDTDVRLWDAVGLSWNVVGQHPVVMGWWALLLALLIGLSLVTVLLGLVLIAPVLGHASWHAYADLKQTDALRQRLSTKG